MAKAVDVCMDNLRRWATNPRIAVIAILILLMEENMMAGGVRAFSEMVGIPVAPWMYPFLTGNGYIALMELFGVILLFCDAPFVNEGTPYLFIRSGRKAWFMGQVLYIFAAAALYQLFIALGAAVLLAPCLMLTPDWGKVLGTLAQTNRGYEVGIVLADAVVRYFSPAQAMLLALGLCLMVMVIFGMTIFAVNLMLPRLWGAIVSSILYLIMPFAMNASGRTMLYFSPGSWMSIPLIDFTGTSRFPPLAYVLTTGCALIAALVAVSYLLYRKRVIDMVPYM